MQDLIFVALWAVFFAATAWMVLALRRL